MSPAAACAAALAFVLSASASAAEPTEPDCVPPTFPLVHRWEMRDGTDAADAAPLAAAEGASYRTALSRPRPWARVPYAWTRVLRGADGELHPGVLVTTLPWPEAWTWEARMRVEHAAAKPWVVARFELTNAHQASAAAMRTSTQAAQSADQAAMRDPEPAMTSDTAAVATWDVVVTCDANGGGTVGLNAAGGGDSGPLVKFAAPGVGAPDASSALCVHGGRIAVSVASVGEGVDHHLDVALSVDRVTSEVWRPEVDRARAVTLRAGIGADPDTSPRFIGPEVWLYDMAILADADVTTVKDDPLTPWCSALATERLPYREPFTGPRFGVRGYYLGLAGRVSGDWAARQRLVVGAEAQVTRNTLAVVQLRTLETRGVASTGSLMTVPRGATTTSLSDFGLTVEQAFVTRNSNDLRSPLFFAAGRIPVSIGSGLGAQNAMGAIDPPPWSAQTLFGEVLPDAQAVRADFASDRTFQTTVDGLQLAVRYRRGLSQYAEWTQVRLGRRNPWCAGRLISAATDAGEARDPCPAATRAVYEAAFVASTAGRLYANDRPNVIAAVGEAGVRYTIGKPGWFADASALIVTPRSRPVWLRLSADALSEIGLAAPSDGGLPLPFELGGSTVGGAVQADLATYHVPLLTLSVGGGWAGRAGQRPLRGLHPDFDVDLVGFEQVVAAATAEAWETGATEDLPSLGGVYGGGYLRNGLTVRIAEIVDVPVVVIDEWLARSVAGSYERYLGTELDVAIRIHAAGWRVGASYGKIWPGKAVIAERGWSGALRLARNL